MTINSTLRQPLVSLNDCIVPVEILYDGDTDGATALPHGTIKVPSNRDFNLVVIGRLSGSAEYVHFRIHYDNSGSNFATVILGHNRPYLFLDPNSFYGISGTNKSGGINPQYITLCKLIAKETGRGVIHAPGYVESGEG